MALRCKEQLLEDGHSLPYDGFTADTGVKLRSALNQMNFATCFLDNEDFPKVTRYCAPKLLDWLSTKRSKRNMFFTSEAFSKMKGNGIKSLSKCVNRRWDQITIVVCK